MIILLKLLIAHFIGDFILQTDAFTKKKEKYKLQSAHLYVHVLLHGLLVLLFLFDLTYWWIAVIIMLTHLLVDTAKLYFTTKKNKRWLFLADQVAHISIIIAICYHIFSSDFSLNFLNNKLTWAFILCVIFLTSPVAIMLKVFFTQWKLSNEETGIHSLKNAGKWIGMLERLFVFIFIITAHWEAVGFLLTAKSVFRFGDLSKAKNMKLTEYVLIGTLLSFGIAILVGLLFNILTT